MTNIGIDVSHFLLFSLSASVFLLVIFCRLICYLCSFFPPNSLEQRRVLNIPHPTHYQVFSFLLPFTVSQNSFSVHLHPAHGPKEPENFIYHCSFPPCGVTVALLPSPPGPKAAQSSALATTERLCSASVPYKSSFLVSFISFISWCLIL